MHRIQASYQSQNTTAPNSSLTTSIFQSLKDGFAKAERSLRPPPPNFPPGPRQDVAFDLIRSPLAFLEQLQRDHGTIVGISLAGERAVLISDPVAAKSVLIDNPSIYIKEGTAFFPGSSLAGNGLLVSDGEIWRRQRRLAAPAFRRAAIERYANAMVTCTQEELFNKKRWRPGVVRDVYADANTLTLQIALQALFGSNMDAASALEVTTSIRSAFEFFSRRAETGFIIPEAVPTLENIQFRDAVKRLDHAVHALIAQRRQELLFTIHDDDENRARDSNSEEESTKPKGNASPNNIEEKKTSTSIPQDLLTAFLLSKDADGSTMNDQSLRDELMTLLVAGQETSAIVLGWTCAYLTLHPEAQTKAADQVLAVLANNTNSTKKYTINDNTTSTKKYTTNDNTTSMKSVNTTTTRIDKQQGRLPAPEDVLNGSFHYLEAILLESLRLMPPAYIIGRCTAADDVELGGFRLPKGTTVLVSPYLLHRNKEYWGDGCDLFDPGRWLNTNNNNNDGNSGGETNSMLSMSVLSGMGKNNAYIPFGAGQRNCIGTGFAMMEAMLVIASILQKFEVVALPGSKEGLPEADPKITLRPKKVRVILRKRKKSTCE